MAFPEPFYSWRPHPWHGIAVGPQPPSVVQAYVEITPFDLVKYEIDKVNGFLRIDRPQRTNSQPPSLYGFVPRTLCGARVGRLTPGAATRDYVPDFVERFPRAYLEELEAFARAVRGEPQEGATGEDGLAAFVPARALFSVSLATSAERAAVEETS